MLEPDSTLILMATRDGARTLPAQLDSLAAQTCSWKLLVSDDRSRDASCQVIREFAARWPGRILDLKTGPGAGFVANFLSLVEAAPPETARAAFCDQDDVWLPDKLARAHRALAACDPARPALYCSRVQVCDADLTRCRPSPAYRRPPGFANALVENIAPGNTIVMNKAALTLIRQSCTAAATVYAHDWWAYLMVSGAGGQVIHDPTPSLYYRQHSGNAIGAGRGRRQIAQILAGAFADRVGRNVAALQRVAPMLSPENRDLLNRFASARQDPLIARGRSIWRTGVYRQRLRGSTGLWGAAFLGKV